MNRDASARNERLTGIGRKWWLLLSFPISLLGMLSAGAGVFWQRAYSGMTASWAQQTFAQDLVDLFLAFPLVAFLAWSAVRGSRAALLIWLGVMISIVYAYIIYCFAVPFGPLHLLNTALLGMSGWALAGGLFFVRTAGGHDWFDEVAPTRASGGMLFLLGVIFYAMWLAEEVPAVLTGQTPDSIREVGLFTNPVHVLDMAFLLPACIVCGLALVLRRTSEYWIAPVLLSALLAITIGIVTIMVVDIREGNEDSIPVALVMAIVGLAQVALLIRYFRHVRPPSPVPHETQSSGS